MQIGVSRIVAGAAIMAYAALALLSGIDRVAAQSSGITDPIGWAYADRAPLNAARAAMLKHQWHTAADFAAKALLADPVNESMLGALGVARLEANDTRGAEAAFRLGAGRGWNDLPTRLYWLQKSIALGDMTAASIQVDAILRGQADDRTHGQVIDALLQYQEGRDALVQRLHADPPWTWAFASGDDIEHAGIDNLAGRAEVITRAGRGTLKCEDTAYLVNRLFDSGVIDEARKLHAVICPHAASPLNDPDFAFMATGETATVLDWYPRLSGDVAVSPISDSFGHPYNPPHIHMLVSRPSTTLVLTQPVTLDEGTYRITWKMPDTDEADVPNLSVNLDCASDLANARPGTAVPGRKATYAATFHFDGACTGATLGFWLKPGKDVNIAEVRLARLPAEPY